MLRSASCLLALALALAACDPERRPKIGTLTAEIRELVQTTTCKQGTLREEPYRTGTIGVTALRPAVEKRISNKPLVWVTCPGSVLQIAYAKDDSSLYLLSTDEIAPIDATRWIEALSRAGLDAQLVREAQRRIAAGNNDPEFFETTDGTMGMMLQLSSETWRLVVFVLK